MIANRPAILLADLAYRTLPKLPLTLDWTSIPKLIRVAMLDLAGVQPVTRAMAEAAGGTLRDNRATAKSSSFESAAQRFSLFRSSSAASRQARWTGFCR
jgi:hypothetical protein